VDVVTAEMQTVILHHRPAKISRVAGPGNRHGSACRRRASFSADTPVRIGALAARFDAPKL
jgi:hypothetical protein